MLPTRCAMAIPCYTTNVVLWHSTAESELLPIIVALPFKRPLVQSYEGAVKLFLQAIGIAKDTQGSHSTWATTYVNLGTAYGKLG